MPFKKKTLIVQGLGDRQRLLQYQESGKEMCINSLGMWGAVNPRIQSSRDGGDSTLKLPLGCLDSLSIFPLENLFQADYICLFPSLMCN